MAFRDSVILASEIAPARSIRGAEAVRSRTVEGGPPTAACVTMQNMQPIRPSGGAYEACAVNTECRDVRNCAHSSWRGPVAGEWRGGWRAANNWDDCTATDTVDTSDPWEDGNPAQWHGKPEPSTDTTTHVTQTH